MTIQWLDHRGNQHDAWRYPEICGCAACGVCGEGAKGDRWAQEHSLAPLPPEKRKPEFNG
jgi:hypothetical protein